MLSQAKGHLKKNHLLADRQERLPLNELPSQWSILEMTGNSVSSAWVKFLKPESQLLQRLAFASHLLNGDQIIYITEPRRDFSEAGTEFQGIMIKKMYF